MIRWLAFASMVALAVALAPGCSLQNVEGPDVTCEDLECGRINACAEGIIAQCLDGQTVRWHVCTSDADDVCDEEWQVEGAFRCQQSQTDCEGCRPERVDGCAGL